jgi:carbon-monoxide dehydrogenase small subunit
MLVPDDTADVTVTVNGRTEARSVPVRLTAADFIRDVLALRGTHVGCEQGACGACTILVDGTSVRSCILLAVQLDHAVVTTVEGLEPSPGELHPLQECFRDCHGLQCGFCTPGFLLASLEYLEENRDVQEADVREALSGNICRCTGYQAIVDAVLEADKRWER